MEGVREGKRTNTDRPKPNLNLKAIKASKTVCVCDAPVALLA